MVIGLIEFLLAASMPVFNLSWSDSIRSLLIVATGTGLVALP